MSANGGQEVINGFVDFFPMVPGDADLRLDVLLGTKVPKLDALAVEPLCVFLDASQVLQSEPVRLTISSTIGMSTYVASFSFILDPRLCSWNRLSARA